MNLSSSSERKEKCGGRGVGGGWRGSGRRVEGEWEEGGGGSRQEEESRHIYRILVPMGYLMEHSHSFTYVCVRGFVRPPL